MPTLGAKIRALRIERGWSQTRLAAMAKVSHSAVSQWEADKTVPGFDRLNALSSLFMTSLLAHGSDLEPSPSALGRATYFDLDEMARGVPASAAGRQSFEPSRIPEAAALATTMADQSMRPRICQGDLLIVDPGLTAGPGDYVLVSLDGAPPTVRRLRIVEGGFDLMPENEDFPIRKATAADGTCRLLGVVSEIRWLRRS